MMQRQCTILLLLLWSACTDPSPSSNPKSQTPRSSKTTEPGAEYNLLTRTWAATGITFNGVADPNFDPARRVELVIRPDGSYTMSGSGKAVDGTWTQEGRTELHLTDKATGSLQRFGINKLDRQELVVKLMDEMNAEVLLHYLADDGPAMAR